MSANLLEDPDDLGWITLCHLLGIDSYSGSTCARDMIKFNEIWEEREGVVGRYREF